MKYLQKTITLTLTLETDDLQLIHWWIDGAFATHQDMQSHTGGAMTLGKGVIYGTLTRQKLNTRSSTKAELVAVDDCMSQVLWTRYFLDSQGYKTSTIVSFIKIIKVLSSLNKIVERPAVNGHDTLIFDTIS